MGKYIVLLMIVFALVMLGCSGKEMVTKDKIPPTKPDLIPHLGDPGDSPDSVYYNGAWVPLTDDANGVDAVPDVDGIRIMWNHLLDLDLASIKVWRFSDYSDPRVIAEFSASQESYTDYKETKMHGDSLYYTYSYFIEVFDRSGNSTKSDTVSYRLLLKQLPVYPGNGAVLSSMAGLNFVFDTSGDLSRYRILLFDEFHELLWSTDIQTEHETTYTVPYTGSVFHDKTMSWRVDAFEYDGILNMYIGSESRENTFTVQ